MLVLTAIFAAAMLAVVGVTVGLLYRTALAEQAERLREIAQSQARMVEAIARHEAEYGHPIPAASGHGDEFATLLVQLRDAHARFRGFGHTGEFTLGRRERDSMVYLLSHRGSALGHFASLPFAGTSGEPMRRALSGLSGTVVGPDYRGVTVLAAYEPVAAYGLGVVAKIDMAEVRTPFVRTGLVSVALALVAVSLGALLFYRVTNPVLQRLAASEGRFRRLYSTMSEGLALHTLVYDSSGRAVDYRILDVNPAFETITGISRDQAIGRLASELYGTGAPPFIERYAQVAKTGTSDSFETEWTPTSKCFSIAVFSPGKGIFATVFSDITERRQAEQALREAKESLEVRVTQRTAQLAVEVEERRRAEATVTRERQRLREVLDMLPAYVVLLAPDYTVPFANRFFEGRFGKSLGRRCYDYLFRRSEPCENCESYKVMKTRGQHHWEWTGPDGRDYDIFDFPFTDTDGSPLILEMGIDITERKQAEQALQKAHDTLEATVAQRTSELRRSNEELEQFAYVASHDLQQPLRMVASYVELLGQRYKGKLDAKADKYIAYAADGARRMQELIHDLLSFSRVGTRALDLKPVDLNSVFQRSLVNLKVAIQDGNADVASGPLPTVTGDDGQLVQLLQNLLDNAIKFRADAAPVIRVAAQAADGGWRISVTDNGIGIEPRHFDRIFRVFQRLHTEQEYTGTGIGLAVCKRIVERHGGAIWVEPASPRGSRFVFTLPARSTAHDGVVDPEPTNRSTP